MYLCCGSLYNNVKFDDNKIYIELQKQRIEISQPFFWQAPLGGWSTKQSPPLQMFNYEHSIGGAACLSGSGVLPSEWVS